MFAKIFVFIALIAFVDAAPVTRSATDQGVHLLHPIKVSLPGRGYKLQPVALKRDSSDGKLGPDGDTSLNHATPFDSSGGGKRRRVPAFELPSHRRSIAGVNRRTTIDLDTFGSRIINGLKANGLDEYVDIFSARIQRLKDILASDASHDQIVAEANTLLLEYRQVLSGINVGQPVSARDIVVSDQVLSQVQYFVNSTVNLLRVLGRSDAVNVFLSEINNLKTEAQNGTLDAGDLLDAARDILLSIL